MAKMACQYGKGCNSRGVCLRFKRTTLEAIPKRAISAHDWVESAWAAGHSLNVSGNAEEADHRDNRHQGKSDHKTELTFSRNSPINCTRRANFFARIADRKSCVFNVQAIRCV
jgi:hypothetical protein